MKLTLKSRAPNLDPMFARPEKKKCSNITEHVRGLPSVVRVSTQCLAD